MIFIILFSHLSGKWSSTLQSRYAFISDYVHCCFLATLYRKKTCTVWAHFWTQVKKVNHSRYRPGVAQRKLRFPDFMKTAQDGC